MCIINCSCSRQRFEKDHLPSVSYLNTSVLNLISELEAALNREKLGLNNKSNLELLQYKKHKIESFLYGGYRLTVPCKNYCEYLNEDENIQECNTKYFISIMELQSSYSNAVDSYNKKYITNQEYNRIKNDILQKDKLIIDEINQVLALTSIPKENSCNKS